MSHVIMTVKFTIFIYLFSVSYCKEDCIQIKPAKIDENWLKNSAPAGFHIPIHSKCQNCKDKHDEFQWVKGRGTIVVKKLCWNMDTLTKWGPHILPFHCDYLRIEDQNCHLDPSNTTLKISLKGNLQITKTDNSTYFAGAMCIVGKENFWFIASTTETIPDKLQHEIVDHFGKLGFKIGGDSIAIEGETPVFIRKLIGVDCPEEPSEL